jgi:hypothetical protein
MPGPQGWKRQKANGERRPISAIDAAGETREAHQYGLTPFTRAPKSGSQNPRTGAYSWSALIPYTAEKRAAYVAAYYAKNRDKIIAKHLEWKKRNPEKANAAAARTQLRRKIRKAGRPPPDLCEICGRDPSGPGKRLNFDHCHATGAFRGWICAKCNMALGLMADNPAMIRKLADYLERFWSESAKAA